MSIETGVRLNVWLTVMDDRRNVDSVPCVKIYIVQFRMSLGYRILSRLHESSLLSILHDSYETRIHLESREFVLVDETLIEYNDRQSNNVVDFDCAN